MTAREASKGEWSAITGSNGVPDIEAINLGSLQRIADATEVMAKRYTELISERDRYKRWYEDAQARALRYERRMTALKGAITRQRKQIQALKAAK